MSALRTSSLKQQKNVDSCNMSAFKKKKERYLIGEKKKQKRMGLSGLSSRELCCKTFPTRQWVGVQKVRILAREVTVLSDCNSSLLLNDWNDSFAGMEINYGRRQGPNELENSCFRHVKKCCALSKRDDPNNVTSDYCFQAQNIVFKEMADFLLMKVQEQLQNLTNKSAIMSACDRILSVSSFVTPSFLSWLLC